MKEPRISNDPKLNDISLTLGEEEVIGSDDEIKAMRRTFTFSAPYRKSGRYVSLPRGEWGLELEVHMSKYFEITKMTEEEAMNITRRYFRVHKVAGDAFKILFSAAKHRIYSRAKSALDGKGPLNAFETKGKVYYLKDNSG